MIDFFWSNRKQNLIDIDEPGYESILMTDEPSLVKDKSKHEVAYEKAWHARKFEIDNYWKRATYFWAFQIASFAAYATIINSSAYNESEYKNSDSLYIVICIGLVTSIAWSLNNIRK